MARRKQQIEFCGPGLSRPKDSFGGSLLKNSHAKTARPLDSRLPVHLVLRASKSVFRLPKKFSKVQQIIEGTTQKYGVRIYKMANVGNHIHLAIRIGRVGLWAAFIRELTARLALLMKDVLGGTKL